MTANELRIGNLIAMNLVDFPENYFKVMEVAETAMMVTDEWNREVSIRTGHDFYDVEDMEAIPLTEEWLKRFGFAEMTFYYDDDKKPQTIEHCIGTNEERHYSMRCIDEEWIMMIVGEGLWQMAFAWSIKHVHQLQNLYFALTGAELTLNQ